jgi:2-dehydro-3-deoxy-L-rhamnonate dehydrogenase (NAD+)
VVGQFERTLTQGKDQMNKIDLQNRHAVVTGGAQGIGFAVAQRLLSSGASVTLWDRDGELLASAVKDLGVGGGAVDAVSADVRALAALRGRQRRSTGKSISS